MPKFRLGAENLVHRKVLPTKVLSAEILSDKVLQKWIHSVSPLFLWSSVLFDAILSPLLLWSLVLLFISLFWSKNTRSQFWWKFNEFFTEKFKNHLLIFWGSKSRFLKNKSGSKILSDTYEKVYGAMGKFCGQSIVWARGQGTFFSSCCFVMAFRIRPCEIFEECITGPPAL